MASWFQNISSHAPQATCLCSMVGGMSIQKCQWQNNATEKPQLESSQIKFLGFWLSLDGFLMGGSSIP